MLAFFRWIIFGAVLIECAGARGGEPAVDFARDIQPLMASRCYECHGEKKQEAGLRLDVRRRALLGGDSGLAIARFSPQKSALIARITHADDDERMPPDEALSKTEIDLFKRWIEEGATWPDELAGKETHSQHWSFQPIKRPALPVLKHEATSPIDAFVLAKLEAEGVTFAPPAERATLLRRLYLDLIGLPPKPEELQAFLEDRSVAAYDKVVERLLASPYFGERWGRHWLDLARFAESDGYENDKLRPNAWRYRDWVVDAVNRDMPFDQFTIEQLAGDLLPKATPEQRVATGFHRNTLWNSAASADKEEFRIRAAKDRAETTATVWLGLTLACAQCHSHKYDPIAQREYYQFFAFFNATEDDSVAISGGEAMALKPASRKSHVHLRGDFQRLGSEVEGGAPAFLPPLTPRGSIADRLDLAKWIVDPNNPLTARVAANHIWQHLFGQGLVASPENFGTSGEAPSHPEMLDWVASELVASGWSRKHLIRTIVRSRAYQQSSRVRSELQSRDPDNRWFARQNRFSVEAEVLRDSSLAVSGLLDDRLGGPSIVPPFPDGLLSHRLTAEVLKEPTKDHHRRSLYIHVQRTLTHPSLAAFDAADGNSVCVRRERSITPTQALTLLNDPVFMECTKALGERLLRLQGTSDERLHAAFQLCLSRNSTEKELALLTKLLDRQQQLGASEAAAWQGVARAIQNLDEFSTRE